MNKVREILRRGMDKVRDLLRRGGLWVSDVAEDHPVVTSMTLLVGAAILVAVLW